MMSTAERLAYMANQIARNLATLGEERAVLAVADHLAAFWDPRMKVQLFGLLDGAAPGLAPIALRAATLLRDRGAPASQTPATAFNAVDAGGGSDAG